MNIGVTVLLHNLTMANEDFEWRSSLIFGVHTISTKYVKGCQKHNAFTSLIRIG